MEFDKIAASRSTPQPKPKSSLLDDLEGLDTQWGSNNPWGSSSFGAEGGGATATSFNPFQPNPTPPNPWGSSSTGMCMDVGVSLVGASLLFCCSIDNLYKYKHYSLGIVVASW